MTTGLGLLRVEFWTYSQMFPASLGIGDSLPPWSCCPLIPIWAVDLWGWLSQWWRPCQEVVPFGLAPPPGMAGRWAHLQ